MSATRVGLATGVFDLFHVGHLNLLERARARCDRLIVGVSSDELAEELKHRRPVVPLEDRMRIVASTRCVDEVIAELEDDKLSLALQVGAQIIFKGSDWENSPKWAALGPKLTLQGIVVVFLPYTTTVSTSELRARALEA